MAPVLSFTAEEIWEYLPKLKEPDSVLLAAFPEPPPNFPDEVLLEKWDLLLKVRSEVNRALEKARREKLNRQCLGSPGHYWGYRGII